MELADAHTAHRPVSSPLASLSGFPELHHMALHGIPQTSWSPWKVIKFLMRKQKLTGRLGEVKQSMTEVEPPECLLLLNFQYYQMLYFTFRRYLFYHLCSWEGLIVRKTGKPSCWPKVSSLRKIYIGIIRDFTLKPIPVRCWEKVIRQHWLEHSQHSEAAVLGWKMLKYAT